MMMWSRSRSPPRFRFIGLKRSSSVVMFWRAVRAADGAVDRTLDRERARLDQLRPLVDAVELRQALDAARVDGDELGEVPLVLHLQRHALLVGERRHDGRVDRAAQVGCSSATPLGSARGRSRCSRARPSRFAPHYRGGSASPASRSGMVSIRSTGSALKTKRTWRSATGPPQPTMAVAAIALSSSSSREASARRAELGDVEEQRPAAARADERPVRQAASMTSRRRSSSATHSATCSWSPRRTAAPAARAIETGASCCRRAPSRRPRSSRPGRRPSRRASRSSGAPSRATRRRPCARPCPRSGAGGRAGARRRAAAPWRRRR